MKTATQRTTIYTTGLEVLVTAIVLGLTASYVWSGLAGGSVTDTSNLPSTAQVNNQSTQRQLVVEASGKACEDGSLQTGTQAIPQANDQATASSTQGNVGPSQSSALAGQLQSRDSCNRSTQTTPLQPAGGKSTFEQFDNAN